MSNLISIDLIVKNFLFSYLKNTMPTINRLDLIASEMIRKNEALGYDMKESVILKAKKELVDILFN